MIQIADSALEVKMLKAICDVDQTTLSQLDLDFFSSEATKEIFRRLKFLIDNGKAIPSASVLVSDQALSETARAILVDNNSSTLSSEKDIKASLEILRYKRNVRLLLDVFMFGSAELQQQKVNIPYIVSRVEDVLQKCCAQNSILDEMKHFSRADQEQLLADASAKLMENSDKDFIPSGFGEFDKRTGGFKRNNVLVLASVPGGGKSAMALQMAIWQYMLGFNVCIVSYEMDVEEIESRLYSNVSKVEHNEIHLKRLSESKRKLVLTKYREWLESSESPNRLSIWTPRRELNINQIALELKPRNYDVIYIDYLSLLYQNPKKQLWENLGEHTRNAKLAAGALNSAWVLLAQFDDKENKIKYSKAVEANANFIWAWDYGDKEKETGIIEVKQLKARNSSTYPFYLETDYSVFSFKDYMGPRPTYEVNKDKDKDNKDGKGREDDDKAEIKRRKKKLDEKSIAQKSQTTTIVIPKPEKVERAERKTESVVEKMLDEKSEPEVVKVETKPKRGIPKMPQLL